MNSNDFLIIIQNMMSQQQNQKQAEEEFYRFVVSSPEQVYTFLLSFFQSKCFDSMKLCILFSRFFESYCDNVDIFLKEKKSFISAGLLEIFALNELSYENRYFIGNSIVSVIRRTNRDYDFIVNNLLGLLSDENWTLHANVFCVLKKIFGINFKLSEHSGVFSALVTTFDRLSVLIQASSVYPFQLLNISLSLYFCMSIDLIKLDYKLEFIIKMTEAFLNLVNPKFSNDISDFISCLSDLPIFGDGFNVIPLLGLLAQFIEKESFDNSIKNVCIHTYADISSRIIDKNNFDETDSTFHMDVLIFLFRVGQNIPSDYYPLECDNSFQITALDQMTEIISAYCGKISSYQGFLMEIIDSMDDKPRNYIISVLYLLANSSDDQFFCYQQFEKIASIFLSTSDYAIGYLALKSLKCLVRDMLVMSEDNIENLLHEILISFLPTLHMREVPLEMKYVFIDIISITIDKNRYQYILKNFDDVHMLFCALLNSDDVKIKEQILEVLCKMIRIQQDQNYVDQVREIAEQLISIRNKIDSEVLFNSILLWFSCLKVIVRNLGTSVIQQFSEKLDNIMNVCISSNFSTFGKIELKVLLNILRTLVQFKVPLLSVIPDLINRTILRTKDAIQSIRPRLVNNKQLQEEYDIEIGGYADELIKIFDSSDIEISASCLKLLTYLLSLITPEQIVSYTEHICFITNYFLSELYILDTSLFIPFLDFSKYYISYISDMKPIIKKEIVIVILFDKLFNLDFDDICNKLVKGNFSFIIQNLKLDDQLYMFVLSQYIFRVLAFQDRYESNIYDDSKLHFNSAEDSLSDILYDMISVKPSLFTLQSFADSIDAFSNKSKETNILFLSTFALYVYFLSFNNFLDNQVIYEYIVSFYKSYIESGEYCPQISKYSALLLNNEKYYPHAIQYYMFIQENGRYVNDVDTYMHFAKAISSTPNPQEIALIFIYYIYNNHNAFLPLLENNEFTKDQISGLCQALFTSLSVNPQSDQGLVSLFSNLVQKFSSCTELMQLEDVTTFCSFFVNKYRL